MAMELFVVVDVFVTKARAIQVGFHGKSTAPSFAFVVVVFREARTTVVVVVVVVCEATPTPVLDCDWG